MKSKNLLQDVVLEPLDMTLKPLPDVTINGFEDVELTSFEDLGGLV